MVVSLFGDSDTDRRDYGFAFGAFKGTAYLGLTMAARGDLSPVDARELGRQMRDGIEIVPGSQLSSDGRTAIEDMLKSIERTAEVNFKPGARND